MANANVDMVKTFILGRAAAREANDHFRRRFDECVVPRTGAPTAGESRLDWDTAKIVEATGGVKTV